MHAQELVETPFGPRKQIYLDYTASGRAVAGIEDYLRSEVLPVYANTHTTHSQTGFQTTLFRQEAREMVARAVNASSEDITIFAGSGATGAMAALIRALDLARVQDGCPPPLVLIGPYAHHSNILGWREAGCMAVILPEAPDGGLHIGALEAALLASWGCRGGLSTNTPCGSEAHIREAIDAAVHGTWVISEEEKISICEWSRGVGVPAAQSDFAPRARRLRIGAIPAASNVTGACNDTVAVTAVLHTYGALAVFDYAAAAPHIGLDMNPSGPVDWEMLQSGDSWPRTAASVFIDTKREGLLQKDAAVFSPHKFVGGPGTPGVLVAKRAMFRNAVPVTPGGGTVFFVNREGAPTYLEDPIERNEGGTPDILGSIRAGLVLRLASEGVGYDTMSALEGAMDSEARRRWAAHPNLSVLGPSLESGCPTVGIVSFAVLAPAAWLQAGGECGCTRWKRQLHWGFVATLLNDLFGIQCRGGCMCAGPYGHQLWKLGEEDSRAIQAGMEAGAELLRPGFVRIALPFHCPRHVFDFILDAVEWVADHGVHLLRQYRPDAASGAWIHRSIVGGFRPRLALQSMAFHKAGFSFTPQRRSWHSFVAAARGGSAACDSRSDVPPSVEAGIFKAYLQVATLAAAEEDGSLFSDGYTATELGLVSEDLQRLRWFVVPQDGTPGARPAAAAGLGNLPSPSTLLAVQGHL